LSYASERSHAARRARNETGGSAGSEKRHLLRGLHEQL